MKRISILILILASFSFGQVTSLSSVFKLGRWTAGNKLNAGTIGDTAQSNASLNYNFDRLDALLGRQIDGNGYFTTLYGAGLGNLIIEARGSHAYRIVLNDSVYSTYDWQTTGNLVVGGNISVGGFLSGDSIILNSGVIVADNIYPSGNVVAEGFLSADTVHVGGGGVPGVLRIAGIGAFADDAVLKYSGDALVSLIIPELSDTIATLGGNQNFTDVGRIVADSVQVDNSYTVLYSDTKIAGTSAGDTSANFTTFLNTTNSDETKVRTTYVHRRGTANIKAYYQIKGTSSIAVRVKLNIYTLDGALVTTVSETSTAAGSYASDVATLPVTALSSNTAYELRFITGGQDTGDEPEVKNLTIIATSN